MTEACSDRHDDIVDALTDNMSEERKAEFEAHTRSCAGCAAEVRQLSSVAAQLRGPEVDLDAVSRFEMPPPGLNARIREAIEHERNDDFTVRQLDPRRRRMRRVSLAVLAAAAVVLAVVAVVGLNHSNPGARPEQVALAAKPVAPGASATASLSPQPYGIAIDLKVAGLDEGTVYALWLANAAGTRSPAGTFVVGRNGSAVIDTRTALPRDMAVKIWITDPHDTTVLAAPLA